MDNQEILDRFDALYNNIMSDRAPGLDAKEISIFFNKAQLEELKNKLNPKGNKYAEGFDFSSKRQVEFSNLTVDKTYYSGLYELISQPNASFCQNGYKFPIVCYTPVLDDNNQNVLDDNNHWIYSAEDDFKNVLSIVNESIDTISTKNLNAIKTMVEMYIKRDRFNYDLNGDGVKNVADVTLMTQIANSTGNKTLIDAIPILTQIILNDLPINEFFDKANYTIADIFSTFTNFTRLTIVPINNVEYDTLMSRPYKYPSHSQAWRMFIGNIAEIVTPSDYIPIRYKMRYIRVPQEVDLFYTDTTADDYSKHCCELPDFLIDEVLQRAVELAKNAWDGTVETTKAFGERSE